MHIVPIYDRNGIIVNHLEINDTILYQDGRVSKGRNVYYKGIGAPYQRQFHINPGLEYRLIRPSDVFYMGDEVSKIAFEGKSGIFQERYQPQFDDFINTCGVKELSIIENSMLFEKSSVVVLGSHKYDTSNHQYYFELDYKCGRRKYLNNGFPKKLKELLKYMIENNWNFIWDKNTITDITYNGLVSDVADIFYSKGVDSKIGTIYSVIYSLSKASNKDYLRFLDEFRLKHRYDHDYVFNTLDILDKFGVDTTDIRQGNIRDIYWNVITNYLASGRNCGHCVLPEVGERIKEIYVAKSKQAMERQNVKF